jgi:bifunctional non-homologous end joining protein LigD
MGATSGSLPTDDNSWSYEVQWGGVRVLVAVEGGRLRVTDGDGVDVTPAYPELRGLGLQLGSRQVLLDGEIVAFNADGRADAARLRARAGAAKPKAATLRSTPVQLVLFDLLHREGSSLLTQSYTDRRRALGSLNLRGEHWQVPESFDGDGAELLAAAHAQGLAGILAKRRNSSYEPGRRSKNWLAITS